MTRNSLTLALVLGLSGAALYQGYAARTDTPEVAAERAEHLDPATGAMLIDFDDDISSAERDELEDAVAEAIAPYAWPEGDAALGTELSEDAQLFRIDAPESEVRDVLTALRGHEDVEAVEVEREWHLPPTMGVGATLNDDVEDARGPFRPDDPYYRHQWHLDQVQMPDAWRRTQGDGVVVAVIDTGVAYRDGGGFSQAPDLAQTRFVPGRDLVDNDDTPDDEHGHGTHVAGTVAQSTNNGVGVAGVAPQAAIMPVRVLDARGAGRWGSVAAGIRWAADNGAHVINLSLGGGTPSRAIAAAIRHAHEKGVVVVAAAGNTGRGRVQYPAANPHTIAVSAVRFDEELTFYSSYGNHLDIAAPGGDIRVDQNGDGMPDGVLQNTIVRGNVNRFDYLTFQGTSMAAPHVAGAAALIRAAGVTDPDAVESILKESAKDRGDARRYGAGLLQVNDALAQASGTRGATRGGLALGLFALMLATVRKRKKSGWVVGGAALLTSGALVGVPFMGAALGGLLSSLGALGALLPLALFALPLIAIGLGYGKASWRLPLAGMSLGFGAFALGEAILPTLALSGGWLSGPVIGFTLALVGLGLFAIARMVAAPELQQS